MADSAERTSRQDADAETRIGRFAAAHPGTIAVVDHVGRVGARVVVIAPSGEFGDALASSVQAGLAACEKAGIEVRQWDRETTGLLTPSQADRVRMGSRQR